ncbi:MAG: hypothetical protein ACTHN7_04905 [Solirubrobacterales bacterium]
MSTCPPFEESGPTSGPAGATADGHIHASATTALAGASTHSAIVGGSFSVPRSAHSVEVSVPITGLSWFVEAAVFLGYMEAEAGFELVVLDPVSGYVARTETSLFRAVAPAFWGVSKARTINIIPSLTIPVLVLEAAGLLRGRGTTWHAGFGLWAKAMGFGGGGASANVFCIEPVPCINTHVS